MIVVHPSSECFSILAAEDDIHEVCDAVQNLSCARWSDLCFALKLPPAEEETIAETYCNDLKRCLRHVLVKWLRKNYNFQKYGHPSWRYLVKAVGDPSGGNDCALAETIGKNHTSKLKEVHYYSSLQVAPSACHSTPVGPVYPQLQ